MSLGPPPVRIRDVNGAPLRGDGRYVLYWMTALRRSRFNFALERAVALANENGCPLLVLEALRCGYPYASDRLHRFVIEGMADNQKAFDRAGVHFHPFVEEKAGAGRGLLQALAQDAVAVVTDDYPTFFLPRMLAAAGEKIETRLEAVDGNGWMPMRSADKVFARAHDFRRFLQKNLRPQLDLRPRPEPLTALEAERAFIPHEVFESWPAADLTALLADGGLAQLPLDHDVAPVEDVRGGSEAAAERLEEFFDLHFDDYADRNDPDQDVGSRLSPYLHFGHLSTHEIVGRIFERESFRPTQLAEKVRGQREGWWGLSAAAESFLDQVITWREVGFNMASRREDHREYDSLPDWARETLAQHESDEREVIYELADFEAARTHDEIWNAAQRQLVRRGRIHNYLRMLWGKKILEWTPDARRAAEIMIELNDRYALDGRDPNSYSGIFWVLGRYDRAWGPERPVYGKIRYMSSDNTRRKVKLKRYLEKYGDS
jgi:deoxyribodipyrimidine photo-lyase